ncbi:MAG: hypothetical protein LBG99_01090 [Propionibacteriaceae bacterium]|jgi:uncharacterized protein with PQ loop repeat|nr:hypothetical protein [Propionibacteriaceae bacterium]
MEFVDALALLGALLVAGISTPQFLLVVRTKDTQGLSVLTWVLNLGTGIGWLNHGFKIGEINMIWPNFWAVIVVITILFFLRKNRQMKSLAIILFGLGVAAGLVALDYLVGSAAYGFAVVLPQAYAMMRQGIELMKAPEVTGVSTTAWVLQVLTQLVWLIWGILTIEYGSLIAAAVSLFAASFVLAWRILRGRGVGPVSLHKSRDGLC